MEGKALRSGYTTGSCAAAAAKAAALYLLTGSCAAMVTIRLPNTDKAEFAVEKVNVPGSCFRVRKDSGDDPDVTHGTYIFASCRKLTGEDEAVVSGAEPDAYKGKGYFMKGAPPVYIDGGPGIGIVTLEGLSCPVGHYAINPVPRGQIAGAVREVCEETGFFEPLFISLSIPEGKELAEKTFNPKLGITGGISILGTSGIVRPMSVEAVTETIRLELCIRAAAGKKYAVFTPGNYGETFLRERYGLLSGTAVTISNFVKDSVLMACNEGFEKILFAGHMGKLIKVAAGIPNTHSRYGDKRMDTFITLLENVYRADTKIKGMAIPKDLRQSIMQAPTTDDASDILNGYLGSNARHTVTALLNETAGAVKHHMEIWAENKLTVEVIVFLRDGHTGCTEGAEKLLTDI